MPGAGGDVGEIRTAPAGRRRMLDALEEPQRTSRSRGEMWSLLSEDPESAVVWIRYGVGAATGSCRRNGKKGTVRVPLGSRDLLKWVQRHSLEQRGWCEPSRAGGELRLIPKFGASMDSLGCSGILLPGTPWGTDSIH